MRTKPFKRGNRYYETITCPTCEKTRTVFYFSNRKTLMCAGCYRRDVIKKEHDMWSTGLFRDITKQGP